MKYICIIVKGIEMKKKKILVTGYIPETGLDKLIEKFDVTYDLNLVTRDWILSHLPEYDGMLVKGLKIDRDIINVGKKLKIITTYGVGFDHIDVSYAKTKGIVVTNCPESVCIPTAELTLSLMLAISRRLTFYDKTIREGKWIDVTSPQYSGMSLQGKKLGIYGMGRIGRQVAKFGVMLGMDIVYHNRHQLGKDIEKN